MEKFPNLEKKEKPPVLYTSAQTTGIKELEPRRGNYRDKDEGSVIFAASDRAYASAFLVKDHGDDWMDIGYYKDIPVVIIKSDRDEFIKNDKGGSMYEVSSDTFDCDLSKGMKDKEWTSRQPIIPLTETHYDSALDTMIDNGVQIYFVDDETFTKIRESDDYGYKILIGLTSENEKRGTNIKLLKDLDW